MRLSRVSQRFFSAMSKITRATKTAVNKLISKPIINVTANPLIWSVPTM
jgi:hypothetical protein